MLRFLRRGTITGFVDRRLRLRDAFRGRRLLWTRLENERASGADLEQKGAQLVVHHDVEAQQFEASVARLRA